jgi:chromosome segregation ATPase
MSTDLLSELRIALTVLQGKIEEHERAIGQLKGELTVLRAIQDLQERTNEMESRLQNAVLRDASGACIPKGKIP